MCFELVSRSGQEIIVETQHGKLRSSISSSVYAKDEKGRPDFTKRIGEDIDKDFLDSFTHTFSNVIFHLNSKYDFSDLVKELIEKLPDDKRIELLKDLKENYE